MNRCEEKQFSGFENDVQLYYCGKREHNYSHHFGPYDRDQYLLYYIKEGRARLSVNGHEVELCGQGFFVNFPHSLTEYHCVKHVPWSIRWVVVDGAMIERYLSLLNITRDMPYLPLWDGHAIEAVFDEMYALFEKETPSAKVHCVSLVHKLFALLLERTQPAVKEHEHIAAALRLIERRFSDPLFNVAALAREVGLNANYFSILFKKETGKTPAKTLCEYRLGTACKMLKFTNKPVKSVAYDCGFSDELYFSRTFKKQYGMSPIQYRAEKQYLT